MAEQKKPPVKPAPKPETKEYEMSQEMKNRLLDQEFEKKQRSMEEAIYGKDSPQVAPKKYAKGGSASSRADGCACRGKTRGKIY